MVTTWYFSLHKVQGVQGNCASNTTVLSRDIHSHTSSWWTTAAIQRCSQTTPKGYTHHGRPLHKIDNSGGRPFTKEKATLKKGYNKNTNMITISAIAFMMLLPLSSSVSTAGEALNLKLDYSLTNEQST